MRDALVCGPAFLEPAEQFLQRLLVKTRLEHEPHRGFWPSQTARGVAGGKHNVTNVGLVGDRRGKRLLHFRVCPRRQHRCAEGEGFQQWPPDGKFGCFLARVDDDEVGFFLGCSKGDLGTGNGNGPALSVPRLHRGNRGEHRHGTAAVWGLHGHDRKLLRFLDDLALWRQAEIARLRNEWNEKTFSRAHGDNVGVRLGQCYQEAGLLFSVTFFGKLRDAVTHRGDRVAHCLRGFTRVIGKRGAMVLEGSPFPGKPGRIVCAARHETLGNTG